MMRRALLLALLAAVTAGEASAATGTLTCSVRDQVAQVNLPQSAGSWCEDSDTTNDLILARVSSSHVFTDGTTSITVANHGYTVYGWATDFIPQTATNVQVYASTTTVVNFNLYHPVLSLSLSPTSISEAGGTSTATVTLRDSSGNPVTLKNALAITASSGNTAKATVSQPAQIAAGTSSTTFTVTGVDNAIVDGNIAVTISVAAGSWGSGSATMTVLDND